MRPEGIRSEFKPIATSAPGVQVCELLPLTAQWMHKTAVVRSVYHNGGCHKNLPMYTGFDVNLPDEEFRDTDPPSMGSVCAYLEREQTRAAAALCLSALLARVGRSAQEGGATRRIPGPEVRSVLHRVHGASSTPAG